MLLCRCKLGCYSKIVIVKGFQLFLDESTTKTLIPLILYKYTITQQKKTPALYTHKHNKTPTYRVTHSLRVQHPQNKLPGRIIPLMKVHLLTIPKRIDQHLLIPPLTKLRRRLFTRHQNKTIFMETLLLLIKGQVNQQYTSTHFPCENFEVVVVEAFGDVFEVEVDDAVFFDEVGGEAQFFGFLEGEGVAFAARGFVAERVR